MVLPLATAAIVAGALLWELSLPRLRGWRVRLGQVLAARRAARGEDTRMGYDPGRELRAEQRARELLRSCVNEEEWAMYRDLGFLRVWAPMGAGARRSPDAARSAGGRSAGGRNVNGWSARGRSAGGQGAGGCIAGERSAHGGSATGRSADGGAPYAYLLYPHKPIVAYVPQTGALLNEYCVAFPDETRPYGSARLPDADDVLAKWMALHADERRLIADANMHLPGRQVDPQRVREDLARLRRWEQERGERLRRAVRAASGSATVRAA